MAQGWNVNATTDVITFYEAPPVGVNNIVVTEYPQASNNTTDIWALGAWSGEFGYPSEVEFFADRLIWAHTPEQPQTTWMSQAGNYNNFGRSQPIEDTDAITATLNARQVNAIRDLVPLDRLILLTSGGEWKTSGGENDVLAPSTIGFKPQTYYGASTVPAIVIGNTALFVQDRGYIVRDISYSFESDGYSGSDVTVFSSHLLEGKPIKEWAYQQVPYSIVWVVRQDGTLLALTYMREQEVIGWTPQETDGVVESVATIPEGGEDAVYVVVRRTIDGEQKRYIERLSSRVFSDVRECRFLDSHLTYRGDAEDAGVTLRINAVGAGGYTSNDIVSVVADLGATHIFTADDVGDQLFVNASGQTLRLEIVEVTVPFAASCRPLRNVPPELQLAAIDDWAWARDTLSGLDHLEGKTVGILADGFVHRPLVVTDGEVVLDEPHALVHIGLPYVADFETLELNAPGAETLHLRNKLVSRVGLIVQDSRGFKIGPDADHLDEWEPRLAEDYEAPPDLQQEVVEVWVNKSWTNRGRVFVRQDDPLPLSILGVVADLEVGT